MRYVVIIAAVLMAACGGSEMERMGGVDYAWKSSGCDAMDDPYLLVHLHVLTAEDSSVLDTRELGRKLELNLNLMDSGSSVFALITGLCMGDSIHMELPADSFYPAIGGLTPPALEGKDVIAELVLMDRLDEIGYQVNKQLFEKGAMARYVERFGWNATLDSATGIYYEKLSAARTRPRNFRKAKMKYIIKTLNDQPLAYSQEGEPWLFDREDEGMLRGLRFVGMLLNESERIRALIPSSMAYGSSGQGRVAPFQPIVVEMELLQIVE